MNAYFFNMTPEERENILDKHKELYNGYQTLQPVGNNTKPLYTQDFANDKHGITLSNKNEVKRYTNMNINESEVKEGETCEQCGAKGVMMEGEACEQCGYKGGVAKKFTGKFDYVEEKDLEEGYSDWDVDDEFEVKVDSDLPRGHQHLTKGDKIKLIKKWKNANSGIHGDIFGTDMSVDDYGLSRDDLQYLSTELDEQGGNAPDMNVSDVVPAFDFESKGPIDAWDDDDKNYFPDELNIFDDDDLDAARAFADYEDDDAEGFSAEDILMSLRDDAEPLGTDTSDDMDLSYVKNPYDFESGGPMQHSSGFRESVEDLVDEDLKESFLKQKNRITEMFEKFKKYN